MTNNNGVTIRAAKVEDRDDLHEVSLCPGVVYNTGNMPYSPATNWTNSIEEVQHGEHFLVAELRHKVVGYIHLKRFKLERLAHIGHISIAVHDDYQGEGVGTALMSAVIDLADNWTYLKRLELLVFTDNIPAIKLYKKLGFMHEGTCRAFGLRNGEFVDAHMMARIRE